MDEYYSVIQFLPEPLRTELKAMPPERAACVQEIRLRAGQAVQFTVGGAWQPAQQLLPAAQTALAIGPRMPARALGWETSSWAISASHRSSSRASL